MESLTELVQFMQPSQRLDLKKIALTHVLGLTGTEEGKCAILSVDDLLTALFHLTADESLALAKDAVLALINLTADESGAIKVYNTSREMQPVTMYSLFHIQLVRNFVLLQAYELIATAISHIINENSNLADPWSMVLSNLTREESIAYGTLDILDENPALMTQLIKAFTKLQYNKNKAKLDYLGPIFCNLTQTHRGRELLCRSKCNLLDKILPFSTYEESIIRRGGVIGILKNICFDPLYHEIILREPDDILNVILYPLCGPEEFTDEENELLPMELQYLPDTKTREEDPGLRKMLLECLLQLCATRKSREHLRSKGVYEILREYHKWEQQEGRHKDCLLACENVVDILIKKEEEILVDNYKTIEVSKDMKEKFIQEDEEYLKDPL
uniref:Protein HGH1 homolog n=1 Tax=Glossina pallidipes TaxID=7398 RepID=A0A1A9ZP45_GLOPL